MKKILALLDRIGMPLWLEWLLGGVFLLRIPSFLEPFYYGDEMIYLTLGNAVRNGLVLYRDIHDNKPPLLYLIAALAGNVFWFKVLLAIFSLLAIVLFWKLATKMFKGPRKVMVATIVFSAMTTLPTFEGNIANAENFMVLFTIAALIVLFTQAHNFKNLFLAGVLFSFASLFKIPAAFELPVIVVFWLITSPTREYPNVIKKAFFLGLGFAIPILISIGWYYFQGAGPEYLRAAFLQNVGYLSSFRPGDVQKPFLVRNAPLLTRGVIVFIGSLIVFLNRKSLSKEFMFASIWLLFTLFAVTLSERPYPHYLLQSAAPAALLIGILVSSKTVEQSLALIPLAVFVFVPFYYKYYDYSIPAYYKRFADFTLGRITKNTYINSFDKNASSYYEISDFVSKSTMPKERIFVWGDSPSVYALTRRLPTFKYTAAYHVADFSSKKDLLTNLETTMPKIIVILPGSPSLTEASTFLAQNYVLISTSGGAQVWHRSTIANTQ